MPTQSHGHMRLFWLITLSNINIFNEINSIISNLQTKIYHDQIAHTRTKNLFNQYCRIQFLESQKLSLPDFDVIHWKNWDRNSKKPGFVYKLYNWMISIKQCSMLVSLKGTLPQPHLIIFVRTLDCRTNKLGYLNANWADFFIA